MFAEAIVATVLLGVATAAPQWGPPGHPVHPTGHPGWPYHPTTTHHATTTTHHVTTYTFPSSSSTFPSSSPAAPTAAIITAKFDNLVVPSAAAASPIRVYEDLFWNGFGVAKLVPEAQVAAVAAGIVPVSSPNVAYYDPAFNTGRQNVSAIYTSFKGSNATSFDLESFYFGCANVAHVITGSNPQNCTVSLLGYDGDSNIVGEAEYNFVVAKHAQTTSMMHVNLEFDSFSNVTLVEFRTSSKLKRPIATFFDNVVYTVHSEHKGATGGRGSKSS